MAPEERTEIVQDLEHSRQEFNTIAAGISESQAKMSPQAGRWSVLECVEHVVSVEERFLSRLESAPRAESPRIDKQKEKELAVRVPDRTARAEAPEPVRPAGRFATLAQALDSFNDVRTRTVRFAETRAADLHSLLLEHPRFGVLNGAEMLVLMAGHARRHAEQLREVKAAVAKS
jgi:hypothetical protein